MTALSTTLFGLSMPSPLILASGPRSYGAHGIQAAFQAGAGGVVTKTLRSEPAHNPMPHIVTPTRIRSLRNTLFNAEQWSDLSWQQWVENEFPALRGHPGILIASIGHTAQEAAQITSPVAESGVVDVIECVAYSGDSLADMVRAIRACTDLPILAKLTFNWGDQLLNIAEAALEAGASGFTAIDSIGPTLQIDIETGLATHGGKDGKAWMSGVAIKPVAIAIVADLTRRFGVPVVGTGGIFEPEDAIEMTMAGASALGACSAPMLKGLSWFETTADGMRQWLEMHGYQRLDDLRGMALEGLPAEDQTRELVFEFEPTLCTLCDQCVIACPYDARELIGDRPRSPSLKLTLDQERCRNCGLCVSVCRTGALRYANWPPQDREVRTE